MSELVFQARAKINLTLDVIVRRDDGYHELKMVLASVGLSDMISLTLLDRPVFFARNSLPYLPSDERNLALKAARVFLERTGRIAMGARIYLQKRIPVAAGLGGGSSDAAAVLNGLNAHFGNEVDFATLSGWALELGSDVPYCLMGGAALAGGRGEALTPLPPMPGCHVVLCRPQVTVSTRAAFRAIAPVRIKRRPDLPGMLNALERGSLNEVARRLYNVFEDPMTERIREIGEIRAAMIDSGALGACMSGTGATVYGLFDELVKAEQAFEILKKEYSDVFLTQSE